MPEPTPRAARRGEGAGKPKREPKARTSPAWARLRLARAPLCDSCVEAAHASGRWLWCEVAAYRRTDPRGLVVHLCWAHAAAWHEADGLGVLERGTGK